MVFHPYDKLVGLYSEFLCFVSYSVLFIIQLIRTHIKYLDHLYVLLVTNSLNLSLLPWCVKSWTVSIFFVLVFLFLYDLQKIQT